MPQEATRTPSPTARPVGPTPPYRRATYALRRWEIVAPRVDNTGAPCDYPACVRIVLEVSGLTGWTELETAGYWRGKVEPGVTFVVYADPAWHPPYGSLRAAMPDQEAIQVVRFPELVELREA